MPLSRIVQMEEYPIKQLAILGDHSSSITDLALKAGHAEFRILRSNIRSSRYFTFTELGP
jgi:hypothetical protein